MVDLKVASIAATADWEADTRSTTPKAVIRTIRPAIPLETRLTEEAS